MNSRAIWAIVIVGLGAVIALLAQGVPNFFLEDDAYFYLQIAWNLGTGHGSTFDGLHVTNGYHLLWMAVLASIASVVHLVSLGKTTFLFAVCVLSVALATISVVSAFRTTPERLCALLLFLLCGITMETTLLAALLLILGQLFFGERTRSPFVAGALCALVPLARIDYFWVPIALLLADAAGPRTSRRLPARAMGIGLFLGIAIHFGIERVCFGTWTSVSSAYKADNVRRAGIALLQRNLSNAGNQLRYVVLLAFAMFAAYGWRSKAPEARRSLALIALLLFHVLAYSAINPMRDWYFAVALVLAFFVTSRAWTPGAMAWRSSVVVLSSLIAVTSLAYLALNRADRGRTMRFVADAQSRLTSNDVVFQIDGSGFIGWWLDARVVNGDGLVNTWEYREQLRADRLGSYLAQIGATHVITNRRPISGGPLLSWHGLTVAQERAVLVSDTGPTRNPLERYRLFAVSEP